MRVSFLKQKRPIAFAALAACFLLALFMGRDSIPQRAQACSCTGAADVTTVNFQVVNTIANMYNPIYQNVYDRFEDYFGHNSGANGSHLQFITNDYYNGKVLPALENFTKQMTSIAMQQLAMIGTFFDAKQQLETQRLYQELQVQAHKDYQPSQDFCTFGTNVRSLAASEETAHFNMQALTGRQMARHLRTRGTAAAPSNDADKTARWDLFAKTYCDKRDNGWKSGKPDDTGLPFCQVAPTGSAEEIKKTLSRQNIDIDYTRLIENPRTLDVAFYDNTEQPTEIDVMAMGNNLFGHNLLSLDAQASLDTDGNQEAFFKLRSIAAKRNVAENSFNAIVGLKANGSVGTDGEAVQTVQFLAAILKELGVADDEIFAIIGENPSYYAQLEILAKKLYQSPDFFAGLYDKPANVARKKVALKAIDLMLDRAIYESQMRQEMVMSVLLATQLKDDFETVSGQLGTTP